MINGAEALALLETRVIALENNTDGRHIRKLIDVATVVSLMRVEDKIKEGEGRVQLMIKAASEQMNGTIRKNGNELKRKGDEVKVLVTLVEKRVGELSKDSAKIQKAVEAVQTAIDELELLENKLIDMINQPDPDTDSRISKLEVLCEGAESYISRLEFFTYLDELRKDRKEVVEPLVLEGLAEARKAPYIAPLTCAELLSMPPWGRKYERDSRHNDPNFRVVDLAQRAARVRASSESVDARVRIRSGSVESSRRR